MMIDYEIIARAINFYAQKNFTRIEAPWLVSMATSAITRPTDRPDYVVQKSNETKKKSFVASGEQSFLYLINKGHLPETGRYQTVTPCMRADDFDQTHTKYFLKNELIVYSTLGLPQAAKDLAMREMVDQATYFFVSQGFQRDYLVIKQISESQIDVLTADGVELGSYGYRTSGALDWVYGTGVAEPRFSSTRRLYWRSNGVS